MDRLLPYVHALEALEIPMEVWRRRLRGVARSAGRRAALARARGIRRAASLVGVILRAAFGVSDHGECSRGSRQAAGSASSLTWRGHPALAAASHVRPRFVDVRITGGPACCLAAAIERILEDSGYLTLATRRLPACKRAICCTPLIVRQEIAERGGSLADAADALDADLESVGDVESLPLEPGRTDVVRAMNLHKAKGLEAPVVFLADPCAGLYGGVNRRIVRDGATARGWFVIEKSRADGERLYDPRWPCRQIGTTTCCRSVRS